MTKTNETESTVYKYYINGKSLQLFSQSLQYFICWLCRDDFLHLI